MARQGERGTRERGTKLRSAASSVSNCEGQGGRALKANKKRILPAVTGGEGGGAALPASEGSVGYPRWRYGGGGVPPALDLPDTPDARSPCRYRGVGGPLSPPEPGSTACFHIAGRGRGGGGWPCASGADLLPPFPSDREHGGEGGTPPEPCAAVLEPRSDFVLIRHKSSRICPDGVMEIMVRC